MLHGKQGAAEHAVLYCANNVAGQLKVKRN